MKIQLTKKTYDSYVGAVVLIQGVYCLIFGKGNIILFSPQSYAPGTQSLIPPPHMGGLQRNDLISNDLKDDFEIFLAFNSLEELFKHYPTINPSVYIEKIKNLCKDSPLRRHPNARKIYSKIIG